MMVGTQSSTLPTPTPTPTPVPPIITITQDPVYPIYQAEFLDDEISFKIFQDPYLMDGRFIPDGTQILAVSFRLERAGTYRLVAGASIIDYPGEVVELGVWLIQEVCEVRTPFGSHDWMPQGSTLRQYTTDFYVDAGYEMTVTIRKKIYFQRTTRIPVFATDGSFQLKFLNP